MSIIFVLFSIKNPVQKWFESYFAHIKSICEDYRLSPNPAVVKRIEELRLLNKSYDSTKIVNNEEELNGNTPTTPAMNTSSKIQTTVDIIYQQINRYGKVIIIVLLIFLFIVLMWIMNLIRQNSIVVNDLTASVKVLLQKQHDLEIQLRNMKFPQTQLCSS